MFGPVWMCLDVYCLEVSGCVWTSLDKIGPVWTGLDQFEQIWTDLNECAFHTAS